MGAETTDLAPREHGGKRDWSLEDKPLLVLVQVGAVLQFFGHISFLRRGRLVFDDGGLGCRRIHSRCRSDRLGGNGGGGFCRRGSISSTRIGLLLSELLLHLL
jgi:hypothetical protein